MTQGLALAPAWRAVQGAAFLACCLILAVPHQAGGQRAPGAAVKGELWFDAKATLGSFRGITRTFEGAITGGAALGDVRGWIEFKAADLTTENGLRDRDMRSSLEVDKFPTIRFDLDTVRVPAPADDGADSIRVELTGRMQIHGVTRVIRVPSVVRRSGDLVRATGEFDMDVTDYRIGGLRKMMGMLSMDEKVRIGFDVTFNSAPQGVEE
jgi:polyisoprenoid-binding protein YceI